MYETDSEVTRPPKSRLKSREHERKPIINALLNIDRYAFATRRLMPLHQTMSEVRVRRERKHERQTRISDSAEANVLYVSSKSNQ